MRHRVIVLGVMLSAVLAPRAASAQRPLSLVDAQAEARVHAPDAAELQARIAAAEAMAAQAARRFRDDPTISGGFSQGRLVGRADESSWTLGIQQPFDLSGSWKPRAASAAADVERTRQEREDGLRALDEQVAIAFADSALAQRQLARGERLADLYRLASDAVRQQFQVGAAPQIDADSAELDLAGGLAWCWSKSGASLDRSRLRLARLLGREGAPIHLHPERPPTGETRPALGGAPLEAPEPREPRLRRCACGTIGVFVSAAASSLVSGGDHGRPRQRHFPRGRSEGRSWPAA